MAENPHPIDPADLPEVITAYLNAHVARDVDRAVDAYLPDASVTDEGRTYRGRAAIRQWLAGSVNEYTYTIEMTRVTQIDDRSFEVTHHLEGNFPGNEVDLRFRFILGDGGIAALTIEE